MYPSFNCFLPLITLSLLGSIVISSPSPLPAIQPFGEKDSSSVIFVGFDLAVDYGTASVKLPDGTFYDAIKIDGEDDYKIMMRRLVDAATDRTRISPDNRSNESKAGLKTEEPSPRSILNVQGERQIPIDSGARNLQASRWRTDTDEQLCSCPGITADTPSTLYHRIQGCHCITKTLTDISTLSTMIAYLRSAVEDRLPSHLEAVVVSVPTITALEASTVNPALEIAGLYNADPDEQIFSAATAALIGTDITARAEDDATCSSSNTLILEYQPFALITTLSLDSPNSSTPPLLDEAAGSIARYSHTFCSEEGYWRYVRAAISRLPERSPDTLVDTVIAVGDFADDKKFMEHAKRAIKGFPGALSKKPKLVVQQPVFSAARGAAELAGVVAEEESEAKGTAVDSTESQGSGWQFDELR